MDSTTTSLTVDTKLSFTVSSSRGGAGVGYLGRHGARLLVDVVVDVGLGGLARHDAKQALPEVLGNDEHGVACTGLQVGHGGIEVLGPATPADRSPLSWSAIMSPTSTSPARSDDAPASWFTTLTRQVPGVFVGVPEAQHVVPRVHRRKHQQRQHHHEGRRGLQQAPDVAPSTRMTFLMPRPTPEKPRNTPRRTASATPQAVHGRAGYAAGVTRAFAGGVHAGDRYRLHGRPVADHPHRRRAPPPPPR